MDLSGVIFVVLAVVWAVFLLPKALRHHDEVAKTRSVEDVSEDARVLARREAVNKRSARLVIAPAATAPVAPVPAGTAPPPGPDRPADPEMPRIPGQRWPVDRADLPARRRAAASAARRRRRILGALLVLDVLVALAALFEVAPVWSPAVPVALTGVYLVLCRTLVKREHAGWDDAVSRAGVLVQEPTASAGQIASVGPSVSARTEPAEEAPAGLVSPIEETSSLPGLVPEEAVEDGVATFDAGSLWDPLPVTLPTYVAKARATRSVRTIDLGGPGVSSSGRNGADSAMVAEAATSTGQDSDPVQRPAVGS